MIPCFQSYNDFINHLNSHYISYRQLFDFSLLNDDFQSAFFKMIWPDVDNTFDILRPLYSNTGRPICAAGFECIRDGFEKARNRHKFRCPFAFKKENSCPLKDKCTKSKYGRVFRIKVENDLRLFGVIQYNSQKWKTIYKDRTSCERMNNRILNDYKFKDCYMHGESRTFFMLVMIGINIHFDAYLKITSL